MTPAQLQERKKGVGSSDCASLFNIGYGCRRRLWYDKTNAPQDFPWEGNRATRLGQHLEPLFAEIYAEETKRTVVVLPDAATHFHVREIRANVDRAVFRDDITGALEIKAVSRGVYYTIKRNGLPEDYILQLQHEILATGWTWGSFAIGNRDSGDLMWWDVERDESIATRIMSEVPLFWGLVENGPAPDHLEPDDRRCQECAWRTTCQGEALITIAPQSEYEQDESLAPLVREFVERTALLKEATELREDTKSELMHRLGTRGMVSAAGAKVQFYEIEKKEYTVKAHKERPLRVYPKKEKV